MKCTFFASAVCRQLDRLVSDRNSNKSMAPPLVFNFIGAVFTAISYGKCLSNNFQFGTTSDHPVAGIYCLILGLYLQIQVKRTGRWNGVLPYAITTIFILCSAYFIILIIQTQFDITVSLSLTSCTLLFKCHGSP